MSNFKDRKINLAANQSVTLNLPWSHVHCVSATGAFVCITDDGAVRLPLVPGQGFDIHGSKTDLRIVDTSGVDNEILLVIGDGRYFDSTGSVEVGSVSRDALIDGIAQNALNSPNDIRARRTSPGMLLFSASVSPVNWGFIRLRPLVYLADGLMVLDSISCGTNDIDLFFCTDPVATSRKISSGTESDSIEYSRLKLDGTKLKGNGGGFLYGNILHDVDIVDSVSSTPLGILHGRMPARSNQPIGMEMSCSNGASVNHTLIEFRSSASGLSATANLFYKILPFPDETQMWDL